MASTRLTTAEAGEVSPSPGRTASPFRVLHHKNFRLLWFGTLVSSAGDWMDQVALNWLVLTLTDSPVFLGVLNLCRGLPILLFTLVGGATADRSERRRMLMITQTVAMLLAVALGALAQFRGNIWLVLLVATARGIVLSFNMPARQALISELVPREDLMAAISLNSASMNFSRITGPAIGGILIAVSGVSGAFYVNAASFLAVIYSLAMMQKLPPPPQAREAVWKSVRSGLQFVRRDTVLRSLLILAILPLVLGMSYMPMLSVFARDVLNVGSVGLGALTSAAGLGSVFGALAVGSVVRGTLTRGRIMFAGIFVFGGALAFFSLSSWLPLSLAMLFILGIGSSGYQSLNNTLIQEYAPDAMRGRVMSMLFLVRGLIPLGTMVAGFGAELVGAPLTMAVFGAVLVVLGAFAAVTSPAVRRLA